jgi:hypothetical protein
MIAFLCSQCGAELRVKDELAGTKGKCPRCKQIVEAPHEKPTDPEALMGETQPSLPLAGAGSGSDAVFDSDGSHSAADLRFLAPPQEPGELGRLGNYRVLSVLGAGGMGIVFHAEDLQLKRPVALKAMKASLAAKADDRQRFLREAQTAAAIDHEHIVTIYQVGEDRGIPFLAMKLLHGESLEDRLNHRGGRLPFAEVLRIGQEVAEGLAAAHERGLIHRDIKPANIWLEQGRDWVRIVDFGLARVVNENVHLTQSGMIIGTPAYMAPEQANAEPLDFRCDLFSLGCVLYRASTGELPFKGKNTMAMLLSLASKTPTPPHELDPSIPPVFSELVMTLLQKKPSARPPSAQAVWNVLENVKRDLANGVVPTMPARAVPAPEEVEEIEEVEDLEEVEVEVVEEVRPKKSGAKRRPSGIHKRKKGRRGGREENDGERKVMILAIIVAIAIFLLVAFLIVRRVFLKPAEAEDAGLRSPAPAVRVIS